MDPGQLDHASHHQQQQRPAHGEADTNVNEHAADQHQEPAREHAEIENSNIHRVTNASPPLRPGPHGRSGRPRLFG